MGTPTRPGNSLADYDYLPLRCVTLNQFKEIIGWL